jgi:hypothetical protein
VYETSEKDMWYFEFPGEVLASLLQNALSACLVALENGQTGRVFEYAMDENELAHVVSQYAPEIQYLFNDGSDVGYKSAMADSMVQNPEQLKRAFHHLSNIARNHSDGDLVTINVWPDRYGDSDSPMSFYWSILDSDGRRIMNGGIIAHAERSSDPRYVDYEWYDRPIVGYEYSTHT